MFKDIYSTTPCFAYNMREIISGLREAELADEVIQARSVDGKDIPGVYLLSPNNKTVAQFAHPVTSTVHGHKDSATIYVNPYVRFDRDTGKLLVTSTTEYEFMVLRARLQEAWVHGQSRELASVSVLPAKVFSRWVSENIARRLNLTPLEQLDVSMVAALYYYYLFQDQVDADDKVRLSTQASRAVNVETAKVLKVADSIQTMSDIAGFIGAVKSVVNSPRTDTLTPALIYGILGGSWFGANAREIAAVALEHPPTFISMIYMAMTNRTYHKCFLSELVIKCDRQDIGKNFVRGIDTLLTSINYE
jgi:hypothetical protein